MKWERVDCNFRSPWFLMVLARLRSILLAVFLSGSGCSPVIGPFQVVGESYELVYTVLVLLSDFGEDFFQPGTGKSLAG